jgi:hypothetical protein
MANYNNNKRPAAEQADSANRTWVGWALFGPRDNHGKHSCKICQKQISYNNSTSSFKKHIKTNHPSQWDELREKKEEIRKASAFLAASPSSPSPSILSLLDPDKIESRNLASKRFLKLMQGDLVRFIVGDVRPFHAVEGALKSFEIKIIFLNLMKSYPLSLIMLCCLPCSDV